MNELLVFLSNYRVVEGLLGLLLSFYLEGVAWFDAWDSKKKRKLVLSLSVLISLISTILRYASGGIDGVGDAIGSLLLSWLSPLAVATANHTRYMGKEEDGER